MANSKYRGSKAYFLCYCALINAARNRGTITYKEIAEITGLPTSGSYMAREVGQLLFEISEEERNQGRPMLSALVVSSTNNAPGPGFFGLAQDWGKFTDNSAEGKRRFWEEEKGAVYAAWRKEFKTAQQQS